MTTVVDVTNGARANDEANVASLPFVKVDVDEERIQEHLDDVVRRMAKAVEYYGWLKDYRHDLATWVREHGLVQTTIELVRVEGLHAQTQSLLDKAWGEIGSCSSTVRIAERLRAYVTSYQPKAQDERFVASTEILESSFGKLKRIER